MKILPFVFTFLALKVSADYKDRSTDHLKVTCGSAIKLTHKETGVKLHSHDIKYGSGSGQQSITGFPNSDDPNSLFLVEAPFGKICNRGQKVECGSVVRLLHLNSGSYLHSHLHKSPLSNQQEVSGFGEGNKGDDWTLQCIDKSEKWWNRDSPIRLVHVETEKYLFASKKFVFGSPIPGQHEVSAASSKNENTIWIAEIIVGSSKEGIYFSDNPLLS